MNATWECGHPQISPGLSISNVSVLAQANKMLGYIRRSTLEINSTLVRRTLYLTLVRSQLCYASQVWAPQSIISIKRIERIQRRATKFILDLPFFCDISYNQRLEMLNLVPVCYWHEYLDMVFFFKCVRGIVNINVKVLPELQSRGRTTRSTDTKCLTFTTRQCKTSTSQKSFVTRSTRVWNILPKKLTEKNTTFSSFKNGLYEYYKSA